MLTHFPRSIQPAIGALWAIDEAMGAVVAGASQPALAGIKLAWWREALCRLDADPAPPEPRLRAVAETVLPFGVSGTEISGLEAGWASLIGERVDVGGVALRGERLFALEAALLSAPSVDLREAGALFALSDAMRRRHGDFSAERHALLDQFAGRRVPRKLRPITLAARLAARPLDEPEGTPGRALALIAHRLTGVITGGR